MKLEYHRNAERPAAELWLYDDDDTLIDFTGYTFRFRIGRPGATALLDKTSSITGAAGSGIEPTGVPNVTVTWAAGELDVAPGRYVWQLTCTSAGLDRVFAGEFVVLDTIA